MLGRVHKPAKLSLPANVLYGRCPVAVIDSVAYICQHVIYDRILSLLILTGPVQMETV